MEKDLFELEPGKEYDLAEREERCQKAIKAVTKAIIMRLLVTGILVWTVLRAPMELWVVGMMVLVLLINLSGIIPLMTELKKRREEWKKLLEEEP